MCKVKFALSFTEHDSASRTQSHRQSQLCGRFLYFLFISTFTLFAANGMMESQQQNDGQRLAGHRWADRCGEQGAEPGGAQLLLKMEGGRGSKNLPLSISLLLRPRSRLRIVQRTQKFFVTCSLLWGCHFPAHHSLLFFIFGISVLIWWLRRTKLLKVARTIVPRYYGLIQWKCSWLQVLVDATITDGITFLKFLSDN